MPNDIPLPGATELNNSSQYIFSIDYLTIVIVLYFISVAYFSWKKGISVKGIISKILFDIIIVIFVAENILYLSFPLSLIIPPKCWCALTLISFLFTYLGLNILVLLKILVVSRLNGSKILLYKQIIIETFIITLALSIILLMDVYF